MAAGPAADGLGRLLVRGAGPAAGQRGGHRRHGHDRLGSRRVVLIRGPVRRGRQLHRYLRQRGPAGDLVGRHLARSTVRGRPRRPTLSGQCHPGRPGGLHPACSRPGNKTDLPARCGVQRGGAQMRFRLRAVCAAVASGTVIAASVAACGPQPAGSASPASSASAGSTTASDTSPDSLPFGSVGGGFVPLAGGPAASVQVGAGQTVTVPVSGHGGGPTSAVGAVALAVAVTSGRQGGSVTVYPAGGSLPDVPSLSWPSN